MGKNIIIYRSKYFNMHPFRIYRKLFPRDSDNIADNNA